MNKNINLVDILKDCPKGTKLYSTIYGEVEIVEIRNNCTIKDPIIYKYKNVDGDYYVGSATIDGKFTAFPDGECTLFPSKDQRNWDKFKVEPEMIDGEFYYCLSNLTGNSFIFIYKKHILYKTNKYVSLSIPSSILFKEDDDIVTNNENIAELRKATKEEKQQLLNTIKRDGYKWDEEKKELIEIESELVDGEIYYNRTNLVEWIYIYKKNYTFKTMHYVAVLNNNFMAFNNICITHNEDIKVLRKATDEEKRLFFEIIEKNGRKWDVIKKELVRIEPKFNINTLKPFDKVLTRDWDDSVWRCNIYEYFKKGKCYPFITMNGVCN